MRDYPAMTDSCASLLPRPNPPSHDLIASMPGASASPLTPVSVRRFASHQQPLLPLKESLLAPKLEPQPRIDLTVRHIPGKTRKRHKVATSCNRCRQNKRKCDSGVPCSNCKRNKADCLYTDAQQSRSTWGDSPLSKEKIMGVSLADTDGTPPPSAPSSSQGATTSASPASSRGSVGAAAVDSPLPSSSPISPKAPPSLIKVSNKPSSTSSKPSALLASEPRGKGSQEIIKSVEQAAMTAASTRSEFRFNPGHASVEQEADLNRRNELLSVHSKQIAKAIRVAKPGPRLDILNLFNSNSSPAPSNTLVQDERKFSSFGSSSVQQHPAARVAWDRSSANQAQPNSQGSPAVRREIRSASDMSSSPVHQQPPRVTQGYTPHFGDSHMSTQQQLSASFTDGGYQSSSYQDPGNAPNTQLLSHRPAPSLSQEGVMMAHQLAPRLTQGHATSTHLSEDIQPQPPLLQQTRGSQSQSQTLTQAHSHTHAQTQQTYHQSTSPSLQRFVHTSNRTSSSAVVSPAVSTPSQSSPLDGWAAHGNTAQTHMDWKETNTAVHQQHLMRSPESNQATTSVMGSPTSKDFDSPGDSGHNFETLRISQDDRSSAEARMQRIAQSILECKNYDYCIMLPRHISQEYDELWVGSTARSSSDVRKIPRQLLMLPKDANFLVDVFFQTAQSLFLLNIIFMAACKHLARRSDIKRAIQFRERAYEVQFYIDENARLSKIQATLLGSQVIYGVFSVILGLTQVCGTYNAKPPAGSIEEEEQEQERERMDLEDAGRSVLSKKGAIPDAAYQQRLWAFWCLYARDCMSRLYFGWPFGMDTAVLAAEFPRIKGCVGLGGVRRSSADPNGIDGPVTGKRRGAAGIKSRSEREKKLIKAEVTAPKLNMYRGNSGISDDDDDDDEDDEEEKELDDDSDLELGIEEIQAPVSNSKDKHAAGGGGDPSRGFFGTEYSGNHATAAAGTKDKAPSFSGLSKQLLERQSRGEDIGRPQGSVGSKPVAQNPEVRRHLERMKMLMDAEEDTTDGGSYSRILFLEEVKLWSIGRRVGLYLQSRSTSMSVSPAAAATGAYSPRDGRASSVSRVDPFGSTISATVEASRCSERAWLEDKELQNLQADLMAWQQDLPSIFRFRQDVSATDLNHKVNGKMAILTMYYYTITIMLQSSYLPIPQYLSSSRSSVIKSPESISQEYDGLFSRATSMGISDDGGTRIKREAEEYFHTGRSPQPSSHGYFNTAHQICTQLSNVLYHHVELLLDAYPNWCTIQCKLNHSLIAALRVSCLNARLSSNSKAIREEAKAGFKMGSALFKRQAMLPEPLTIRDWPAEEDVQVMLDLEEEFRELMTNQEEEEAMAEARSRSGTRDMSEGLGGGGGGGGGGGLDEYPGDHLLYTPEEIQLQGVAGSTTTTLEGDFALDHQAHSAAGQFDIFHAEHVFGLEEGFHFDYNLELR
ncbi:hypothetical protein BGZ70_010678 [Mortierella alpina]|uniref:Zn(2)-C6 fungal-type domain-containing protein n=1 Tax=Mortierella alpina TaxID=64518 RepID=A0A9P6J0M7_MORAP|nr:hypothetical protein BGZ70_010678 [Mortierella alpina]